MLDPLFNRLQSGVSNLEKKLLFGCGLIVSIAFAGLAAFFIHSYVVAMILIVLVTGGLVPIGFWLRANKDPNEH
jgi:hypothetical protein